MTADAVAPPYVPAPALGRSRRVLDTLRTFGRAALRVRLHCLFLGHDDSFGREPGRLRLRCTTCGRETSGWEIGPGVAITAPAKERPQRTVELDARVRVGPWTLRRPDGRGAARERERQRLVAAAARAAEPVATAALLSYVERPAAGRQTGSRQW